MASMALRVPTLGAGLLNMAYALSQVAERLYCRSDETFKNWVRLKGLALELWVKLTGDEKWMVLGTDHFDKVVIGEFRR